MEERHSRPQKQANRSRDRDGRVYADHAYVEYDKRDDTDLVYTDPSRRAYDEPSERVYAKIGERDYIERVYAEARSIPIAAPVKLYPMKRIRKPELWQFVVLSTKTQFSHLPAGKLSSGHAEFAFCLECRHPVPFNKGSNRVKEHMERYHMDKLNDFLSKHGAQKKVRRQLTNTFARPQEETSGAGTTLVRKASEAQQLKADNYLATWIACSLRPLNLVNDSSFRDYIEYLTQELGGVEVEIPGRTRLRGDIVRVAAELRASLKQKIASMCKYYSATTDIWTDRSLRSYMALTLHHLGPDFESYSWTLEVQYFPGSHTGQAIASALETMFNSWGFEKSLCVKLLHDGASNAVLASESLGVSHMQCLAHAIQVVVGGAMIMKKGERRAVSVEEHPVEDDNGDTSIESIREAAQDEVEAFVANTLTGGDQSALQKIRAIVQIFRSLAVYFHRSSKGKHRLEQIQVSLNPNEPGNVLTDCSTRWNSCWEMLVRMKNLQLALDHFFSYMSTAEGNVEFKGVKLHRSTASEWFAIKLLLNLLGPFAAATETLSGQQYPTLVMAFPTLRGIKVQLEDETLFAHDLALVGEGTPFVHHVIAFMDEVRVTMLRVFRNRLSGLNVDVLWVSYLDPRLTEMAHLQPNEPKDAKEFLLTAAVALAMESNPLPPSERQSVRLLSPVAVPVAAKTKL